MLGPAMELWYRVDEEGVNPCNDTGSTTRPCPPRSSPRVHPTRRPAACLHALAALVAPRPLCGAAVGPPFPRLAAPRPETAARPPRPSDRPGRRPTRPEPAVRLLRRHRLVGRAPRPALEGRPVRGPTRPPPPGPVAPGPFWERGPPVGGLRP